MKPEEKMAILMVCLPPEVAENIMKFLAKEEVAGISTSTAKLPDKMTTDIKRKVINEFFPETMPLEDIKDVYEKFTSIASENHAKTALFVKSSLFGGKVVFNDISLTDPDMFRKAEAILEEIKNKDRVAEKLLNEAKAMTVEITEKTREKCSLITEECKRKGKKLIDDVKSYSNKLVEDTHNYCNTLIEDGKDLYEQKEPSDSEEALLTAGEIIKESQRKAKTVIEDAKSYCQELHKFAKHEGFEYGKTMGFEEGKKEGKEILREAFKIKNYFTDERNKFFSHIDSQIADMAITVAEKIIKREVTVDQNTVLELVKDRLKEINNEEDIILLVNHDDYEYLKSCENELRKMLSSVKRFNIETDDRIEKGGCVIARTLLDCSRVEFYLETLKVLFEDKKNQSFMFEGGSDSHV